MKLSVTPDIEERQASLDRTLDAVTADQRRSRRPREVRARTIDVRRMTKRERAVMAALYPDADEAHELRPKTRGECVDVPRPCPFVSCRHHLYLDVVGRHGNIKANFPDLEPDELADSCSLDVAEDGPCTLERVGATLNMTRERVRQIEGKVGPEFARRVRLRIVPEDLLR